LRFFVTAAKGTEPALRDELRELRFRAVRADRGGVHFEGDWLSGLSACLQTRVGLRVLTPVAGFECPDEDGLYEGVGRYDWTEVLSPRQTLSVSAVVRGSRLTHTQYIAQRTKDAIVDQQRERQGARSSVDPRDADVAVFVHLVKDQATVHLDLAGTSLHRRGYRLEAGGAPLKENLAAAVLRYSGWDRDSELCDPVCGAGTLAIEAAAWAAGIAPGLGRDRLGVERWAGHDAERRRAADDLRTALRGRVRADPAPVVASDADAGALELCRNNARRAGVKLQIEQRKLGEVRRPGPGALLGNPPYGHRLRATPELGRELARLIDNHQERHVALLLASDQPLGRTHRRPEPPRQVFNGDIECVVRLYAPKLKG
jgi:putative N6-adenine-specific DNA methylase